MTKHARIEKGIVCEVIETDHPIAALYHPDLLWIEIDGSQDVVPGWVMRLDGFSPPDPVPVPESASQPDLAQLLHRLTSLESRLDRAGDDFKPDLSQGA